MKHCKEGEGNLSYVCPECSKQMKEEFRENHFEGLLANARTALFTPKKFQVYFKVGLEDSSTGQGENFWIKVTNIKEHSFTGTVANNLVCIKNFSWGDPITCSLNIVEDINIINVQNN